MPFYYRPMDGTPGQIWEVTEEEAVRVGVPDAKDRLGSYFKAEPGEDIWAAMYRQASGFFGPNGENLFVPTVLAPGQFYPRIARPIDQHPYDPYGYNPSCKYWADLIAIARGQLTALTRQLDRICQTVHPTPQTFDTFGHDIRNLLILACTEVENHWRGVLVANGRTKDRMSTEDYVALLPAMKLDAFSVRFPTFPWLPPIKPFEHWNASAATKSLTWYAAYNGVKHDRESRFEEATLLSAFEAVAANVVMLVAQFGLPGALGKGTEVASYFGVTSSATWPIADIFIMPYGQETGEWSPVNYPFP